MERVGKYQIVRQIGSGGFGVVYEGRDPFIRRRVAIKTCTSDDADLRQRFYREAQIAGNLQHDNIVKIHDFGLQDDVPYLVQEYLEGEDLEHALVRGDRIPIERKVEILLETARGIEHAHAAGVIHRDIKPSNIRLLTDGGIKILDFGIAKLAFVESRLTREGMTVGTAAYLSPEQIRGEKIDFRADVYAYGVVAYELFAGSKPFDSRLLTTLLHQVLTVEARPLAEVAPGIPERLARLVDGCLVKEASRRVASFSRIVAELELLAGELERTPPPGEVVTGKFRVDAESIERQRRDELAREAELAAFAAAAREAAAGGGGEAPASLVLPPSAQRAVVAVGVAVAVLAAGLVAWLWLR